MTQPLQRAVITSYAYEVYRGDEKLYRYDDFPHPNDAALASTMPHHGNRLGCVLADEHGHVPGRKVKGKARMERFNGLNPFHPWNPWIFLRRQ